VSRRAERCDRRHQSIAGADQLLERGTAVTWFRREREQQTLARAAAEAAAFEAVDSPAALRTALYDIVRLIRQNSGRLPGEAVVDARRLTDTLDEVIETSAVRPLDVYTVVHIRATLDDYLPTTLQRYLALDTDLLDQPRASGETPRQSLIEQLKALQTSADAVLIATHQQDVDALMTQGAFLRTKFSGSDLDL
jgi:hypothetical protein